jgi:hypothetical protein
MNEPFRSKWDRFAVLSSLFRALRFETGGAPGYPSRLDLILALGCSAIGAILSLLVLLEAEVLYFFQGYMPEMIYSACGFGFVHPVEVPRAVMDFLLVRTTTFDCATLSMPAAVEPPGVFVRTHLYLALAVSALWRVFSVDYRSLWPLISLFGGAYAGGCFVLLRLFFGRLSAFFGGLVLALSPAMLSIVMFPRDFAKAPFFIWTIVLLLLALRAPTPRKLLLWTALAGAVVGAGYGFRTDPIVLLPVGVLFLALGLGGWAWRLRASALVAFIAATLLLASPMLLSRNQVGFGTVFMQGLSEPFRVALDLGEAPYALGQRYSDELVLSSVAADLRPTDPQWDAREARASQGVSQSVTRSGPYVRSWAGFFSGDLATQALKSAAWIIGFPALIAPARRGLEATGWGRSGLRATRLLSLLYNVLGRSWLPAICAVGFIAFFWRVTAADPRAAFALFVMFGSLLCYPVVQFSIRHVFHLEFVWVLALLALLHLPSNVPGLRRVAPRFAASCAIVLVAVIGVRAGLIAYQDRSLHDLFGSLLKQPRELVTSGRSETGGNVTFSVPLPREYRALVEGRPDSMTNFIGEGLQWDVRAAADRLLLTVGTSDCPAGKFNLSFQYAKRDGVWQPFDHDITVEIAEDRLDPTIVLVPAFYRPSQYFSGIRVPGSRAACIAKIERVAGATKLPVILTAVLAPGWEYRPLHRAFGGFPVNPKHAQ